MLDIIFTNALTVATTLAIVTDILVRTIKWVGLNKIWAPSISIVIGVLLSWAFFGVISFEMLLAGVLAGAISCGWYDLTRKPTEAVYDIAKKFLKK